MAGRRGQGEPRRDQGRPKRLAPWEWLAILVGSRARNPRPDPDPHAAPPRAPRSVPCPGLGPPGPRSPGRARDPGPGGDARPGGDPVETQKAPSSPFGGFGWLPMVAIFAILWFVMIGPERKNKKQREALLANLKKGDEVMLSSGLYAKVASIQDDVVVLQIADGVRAKYSRASIQSVVTKAEASAPAAD